MTNTFFRFEFKYQIPAILIPSLENDLLAAHFVPDKANVKEHSFYYVSSIYFDTPTLSDYFDKAAGLLNRKKIRIRIHERSMPIEKQDDFKVWLEIKEKHDMMIWKRRVCITLAEFELFMSRSSLAYKKISERLSPLERANFSEFIFTVAYQNRRPYIVVQYKRRAFHYSSSKDHVRVTLDYNIRAGREDYFCANPSSDVSGNLAVMELKFKKELPASIKFIIHKYNLVRNAYSKYASSVDAVRRFYPINR